MVPRVSPAELAKRSPYDFVKVSFPLDWMVAETAAEELKPMVSPNGKLNALKNINRLEVMDAVINLRDVQKVLGEEQSHSGQERLVREFVLQFARASEVVEQLNDLLGVDNKKASKGPMTPEQMQMQQQQAMMRAQQMQQQQQQGGKPAAAGDKPPVNLVVNMRKNSIVASAPPDKMAVIEQAVKVLDVASQGAESLLANVNRMQVYRLGAMDPEPLVKTITELGVLDPMTRLEVDKRNRSIIAYAPIADHLTIRALVNKLDGSGRKFEVVQLRRLEADYVAGTVDFMMGGNDKDKQQQRRPFYYDFGYYGGRQQEETSSDKFRVDADVENNRLLLWANQIELDEVMNLLAKLGEVPARGANTNTVRVLNVEPGEDAADALERLRRAWPSLSPNPLVMPEPNTLDALKDRSGRLNGEEKRGTQRTKNEEARRPSPKAPSPADPTESKQHSPSPREAAIPKSDPEATVAVVAVPAVLRRAAPTSLAENETAASPAPAQNQSTDAETPKATEEAASTKPASAPDRNATRDPAKQPAVDPADDLSPPTSNSRQPDLEEMRRSLVAPNPQERAAPRQVPPVNISVGPNGELIISSPDTEALDLFEEMVHELAPQRREYKVFYLKHASAFSVCLNLEEYFEIDKKKDDNNNRYPFYYYGYDDRSQSGNEPRRLSKRRQLKFIYDTDSNTILAQGADPNQLKVIEELIDLYDRPEPVDSRAARMTTVFTLKWSKAKIVGEAVKDVYRDLLSSNDKALQQGDQQKNGKRAENVYITQFGGDEGGETHGTQVRFKGKLSIGIDEFSNTIVVSTEGENLMNNVAKMIESLDEAARPAMNRVQVMRLGGSMDSKDVRKALARAFIDQARNGQQPQPGQQQPGQNGQQQPNQQGQPVNQNGQNPQEQ
jgi:hypothetical protein